MQFSIRHLFLVTAIVAIIVAPTWIEVIVSHDEYSVHLVDGRRNVLYRVGYMDGEWVCDNSTHHADKPPY